MNNLKNEIYLKWSKAYSLKNFNTNDSLKEKLDFKGIYLNIISMNGFNRISYIGEAGKGNSTILHRWEKYYKDYHCDNDNEGHTMDLSKIVVDPYEIFTKIKGNNINRMKEEGIYYEPKKFGNKCSQKIRLIREKYFDNCYIAFSTNEILNQNQIRLEIQSNIQQYFIDKYEIVDYNANCYINGRSNAEKNYFKPNLIIYNEYEDNKLENLPFRINFS